MLLVIFVVVPALLATWVSYWSTNLFKALSNRASRITCLVVPGVLAIATGISIGIYLGASWTDVEFPDLEMKNVMPALLVGVTILLIVPTLLVALLAGELWNGSEPPKHRDMH